MTLIIGLKCTDGLVFAADSMTTEGSPLTAYPVTRHESEKLCICDEFIWGSSGNVGVRQEVEDELLGKSKMMFKNNSAVRVRAALVALIKPILIRRYQDAREVANVLSELKQPVPAPLTHFIFGARINGDFELINIEADLNGEVVTSKHCATGSGMKVGQSLLRRLRNQSWNTKTAEVIAYRTMADAIHIEPSGIGPPICLARLAFSNGKVNAVRIVGADLDAIRDASQAWMEMETEALASTLTPGGRPLSPIPTPPPA